MSFRSEVASRAIADTRKQGVRSPLLYPSSSACPSPEPDIPARGRKRRREDELMLAAEVAPSTVATTQQHLPSGESATFRGRCRRRSASMVPSSTCSRNTSRSGIGGGSSYSPPAASRRRLLDLRLLRVGITCDRRRSQSPSRSCSPGSNTMRERDERGNRRRQRTRSRGRDHCHRHREGLAAGMPLADRLKASSLRAEVGADDDHILAGFQELEDVEKD